MTIPLQTGLPVSPELLLVLALAAIQVVVAMAIVIYRDAKDRNSRHALAWGSAAFFGGLAVWVLYFVVREELGPDTSSATGGL